MNSKLGFGVLRFPVDDPNDLTTINIPKLIEMVDYYIAHGGNYFDNGYFYHNGCSEPAIRKAVVERYPREQIHIATKMVCRVINSLDDAKKMFNEQLERLGVDYFDTYMMHDMRYEYYLKCKELGVLDYMQEMIDAGVIKHFGMSYHGQAKELNIILDNEKNIECCLLQLNYMDWEDEKVQSRLNYEACVNHGVDVYVMEPCKGGMLAKPNEAVEKLFKEHDPNMSVASWALRFAAHWPGVKRVFSGATELSQLVDNMSYIDTVQDLTDEELEMIWKARDMSLADITIPCTDCKYCMEQCPMNIATPRYFELYNRWDHFGGTVLWQLQPEYEEVKKHFGGPRDCIGCGLCEKACPQQIKITEWLKTVADRFE